MDAAESPWKELQCDNVFVFSPEQPMEDIQTIIDEKIAPLSERQAHFSQDRKAILFLPGLYTGLRIPIGYYCTLHGLGMTPAAVEFQPGPGNEPGPICHAADPEGAGSLDTFWRSAENFTTEEFLWAVSQAAPLRSVVVNKKLLLHDQGKKASGGFMANCKVHGGVEFGSQQQFMMRNCGFEVAPDPFLGVWSYVFSGCTNVLSKSDCSGLPRITVVPSTPLVAEKPYLVCDGGGEPVQIVVPPVERSTVGPWAPDLSPEADAKLPPRLISPKLIYPGTDPGWLRQVVSEGFSILLLPGIYKLEAPLEVRRSGQVVLGLGMATLVAPPNGPCIKVAADVRDVRIASLMLQAGKATTYDGSHLMTVGDPSDPSVAAVEQEAVTCVLSDIFCRVGGPDTDRSINVETIMGIYASDVILDNIWLWVADHALLGTVEEDGKEVPEKPEPGEQYHLVRAGEYTCDHGLIVKGANVKAYGLAVEHSRTELVQWSGPKGLCYFYQSELPYWVPSYDVASFHIENSATDFDGRGLGIYSCFRDHEVWVRCGMMIPSDAVIENAFTVFLNFQGGIQSVIQLGRCTHSDSVVNFA